METTRRSQEWKSIHEALLYRFAFARKKADKVKIEEICKFAIALFSLLLFLLVLID